MEATIVTRNGGSQARITIPTHPMPKRLFVAGWPFDIEFEYFMQTGKAVYSGYFPIQTNHWSVR